MIIKSYPAKDSSGLFAFRSISEERRKQQSDRMRMQWAEQRRLNRIWAAQHSACRKCGGEMKPGILMEQTYTGFPEWPGSEIRTLSFGGPGKLVPCSKCSACGWSVTAGGAK